MPNDELSLLPPIENIPPEDAEKAYRENIVNNHYNLFIAAVRASKRAIIEQNSQK